MENLDHKDHREPQELLDNRVVLDLQDLWVLQDQGVKMVSQEHRGHREVGENPVCLAH